MPETTVPVSEEQPTSGEGLVSGDLPVSGELTETLRWATASLVDIYGSGLQRLILFGSRARGDATPESDVDVLVVIDGSISSYEEAKRTSRVATHAAAYRNVALSFVHMSAEEFADEQRPLVRSVKEEGIDLLETFSDALSSQDLSSEARPSEKNSSRAPSTGPAVVPSHPTLKSAGR